VSSCMRNSCFICCWRVVEYQVDSFCFVTVENLTQVGVVVGWCLYIITLKRCFLSSSSLIRLQSCEHRADQQIRAITSTHNRVQVSG
jgi:hypothetical protein